MNIEEEAILLANVIDEMDYFQILRIDYHSHIDEIHRAYQNAAKTFHPDHFLFHENQRLKEAMYCIAKLITEAYAVLKDDNKRKLYINRILSNEREKWLRFHDEEPELERSQRLLNQQRIAKTELGKQSYSNAVSAFEAKNFKKAKQHILSALLYEKNNAVFLQILNNIENELNKK